MLKEECEQSGSVFAKGYHKDGKYISLYCLKSPFSRMYFEYVIARDKKEANKKAKNNWKKHNYIWGD